MNAYTNQYLESQVNSASPEQLLLMFYDGAIRFNAMAVQSITNEDIEKRNYYINKTTAIISELAATLDHNVGAVIADDLDALYNYMLKELMSANVNNDPEPLMRVDTMLRELRQTWGEAVEIVMNERKNQQPAQQVNTASQHA